MKLVHNQELNVIQKGAFYMSRKDVCNTMLIRGRYFLGGSQGKRSAALGRLSEISHPERVLEVLLSKITITRISAVVKDLTNLRT